MKDKIINNLFDPEDCIVLKNKKVLDNGKTTFIGFETKPSTAVVLNDYNYFCTNPIDVNSNGAATNSNIITYRTFLIENDTLARPEQLDIIVKSGLPVSNQIFSGKMAYFTTEKDLKQTYHFQLIKFLSLRGICRQLIYD